MDAALGEKTSVVHLAEKQPSGTSIGAKPVSGHWRRLKRAAIVLGSAAAVGAVGYGAYAGAANLHKQFTHHVDNIIEREVQRHRNEAMAQMAQMAAQFRR